MFKPLTLQGETIFYVGWVATRVGKVFFSFIDQDRHRVEHRTHAIWQASNRNGEGATCVIASISLPSGKVIALGSPYCQDLAG